MNNKDFEKALIGPVIQVLAELMEYTEFLPYGHIYTAYNKIDQTLRLGFANDLNIQKKNEENWNC